MTVKTPGKKREPKPGTAAFHKRIQTAHENDAIRLIREGRNIEAIKMLVLAEQQALVGDMLWDAERRAKHADFTIWTTGEGRRLRISKMTDQHIMNAINYLKRAIAIDAELAPVDAADIDDYYAASVPLNPQRWIQAFTAELTARKKRKR